LRQNSILQIKYLPLFIIFFLIFGCKGEKVETPPQKPDQPQIAETSPVPQSPKVTERVETHENAAGVSAPIKDNTAPEIVSIKLSPKLVYPGTKIKAEVEGSDKDGNEITFYYEWKKDDKILPDATTNELDTTGFKKGELVTLYATPFDGKKKGKTRWSTTIMITNRSPEITSIPSAAVSNGKYVYEVKAVDPDGDTLTFSLEGAPSGMTIDPTTGIIQWNIPPEAKRIYSIRIVVTDGDAKAFQVFTLSPEIETK
jgi:hypothetical protein